MAEPIPRPKKRTLLQRARSLFRGEVLPRPPDAPQHRGATDRAAAIERGRAGRQAAIDRGKKRREAAGGR